MAEDMLRGNAVVAQSGGPTAVINQSIVGVIETLRGADHIPTVYGARHGVRGMVEDDFIDVSDTPRDMLDRIANTPSAALGSTRDKPDAAYGERIVQGLKKHDIRYLFYCGGNDSSDTCRIVTEAAKAQGYEFRGFHVPKTVDNDLVENDHTPGYASAARYVAKAFMGDGFDNRSLPGIKINVVMGRHAGFLTAAAALAKTRDDDGPHLICVPERAFDIDAFAARVEAVFTRLGRCQIAVSEGIQDADGTSIGAKLIKGETDDHGNVQLSGSGALGDQLANWLKQKLTPQGGKPPRVRADTLGYAQRSYPDASPVDQAEAREAGRFAAEEALDGAESASIALVRESDDPYRCGMKLVPLTAVAAKTRHLPDEHIGEDFTIRPAFCDWLRPLVGQMPDPGWF